MEPPRPPADSLLWEAADFRIVRCSASAARISSGSRTCGSGGSNVNVDTLAPVEVDDARLELPGGMWSIPILKRIASPSLRIGLPAPETTTGKYSIPGGQNGPLAGFPSSDTHSHI